MSDLYQRIIYAITIVCLVTAAVYSSARLLPEAAIPLSLFGISIGLWLVSLAIDD